MLGFRCSPGAVTKPISLFPPQEIARVGAERRHSLDMQTRALSDRLAVALSEKKAACAELEKARSEVDAAKRTLDETAASEAMLKIQLESYSDEKNHLQVCCTLSLEGTDTMVEITDCDLSSLPGERSEKTGEKMPPVLKFLPNDRSLPVKNSPPILKLLPSDRSLPVENSPPVLKLLPPPSPQKHRGFPRLESLHSTEDGSLKSVRSSPLSQGLFRRPQLNSPGGSLRGSSARSVRSSPTNSHRSSSGRSPHRSLESKMEYTYYVDM